MFSKYIVFVEGDTEYGAIPIFSERLNLNLDEKGIGIIKLDGAGGVKRCMKLYQQFGISNIAIIDRDKFNEYGREKGVYFTDAQDYEEDIYNNFCLEDYIDCCNELGDISVFIGILKKKGIIFKPKEFIQNPRSITIPDVIQKQVMQENWDNQTKCLKLSKNASKGAILAEYVTVIPRAFEKLINKLIREVK